MGAMTVTSSEGGSFEALARDLDPGERLTVELSGWGGTETVAGVTLPGDGGPGMELASHLESLPSTAKSWPPGVAAGSARSIRALWRRTQEQGAARMCVADGGRLMVEDGVRLWAHDGLTGRLLWDRPTGKSETAGHRLLGLASGRVLVTAPGGIEALDAATGESAWWAALDSVRWFDARGDDLYVWVDAGGAGAGRVFRLRGRDGRVRSLIDLPLRPDWVTLTPTAVLLGRTARTAPDAQDRRGLDGRGPHFISMDRLTGEPTWELDLDVGTVGVAPVMDHRGVLLVAGREGLSLIETKTGRVSRQTREKVVVTATMASSEGWIIAVGGRDPTLQVRAPDLTVLRTVSVPEPILRMARSGDRVAATGLDSVLLVDPFSLAKWGATGMGSTEDLELLSGGDMLVLGTRTPAGASRWTVMGVRGWASR